MRRLRAGAVLLVLAAGAAAQGGPRLTGAAAVAELGEAQRALLARAETQPGIGLEAIAQRLAAWRSALEQSVGRDAAQPVDMLSRVPRAMAWRAHAAALRTRAYLGSCTHCVAADAAAMAQALATTVERLADTGAASSDAPAVIESIETADGRAIFALRGGSPGTLVLTGRNLVDPSCPDPALAATDAQGTFSPVQPRLLSAQPGRVEWTLPPGAGPPVGGYVLHLVSRRKVFLRGCVEQPEAVAALQVATVPLVAVSYAMEVACRAGTAPPHTGTLDELAAYGAMQARAIDADACDEPTGYALSARVRFADGAEAAVGPLVQPVDAGITAGLPGGLSLQWSPATRQLIVRTRAETCQGID